MSPSHTYTPEVQAALAERDSHVAVDADFADRMVRQRDAALASEHAISAAYVRLRVKLQALDIPPGSTPEQIRAHTDARLDQVLVDLAASHALNEAYRQSHDKMTVEFQKVERQRAALFVALEALLAGNFRDEAWELASAAVASVKGTNQ